MENEHGPLYTKVKKYYPATWNTAMVMNAVEKGKITPEDYEDITGEKYGEE